VSSKQCSHLASQRLMIVVVSGTRPNVFAERFSRERSGLRAEPVVEAAGGELLGGTLYALAPRYEGVPLHIHHGMAGRRYGRLRASPSSRPGTSLPSPGAAGAATRWLIEPTSRCGT